ncbi:rhomboid family intramembrane serine protease GlpG [Shewanella gelidii]|uniref:Rhomboid family intramembrane serine protease GlpG n=1 Tax=Shewanella gelidii TaxID=1642821 RepID=A0A917NA94_9GAMM|nr:rhomboid family intramembrane serine protease GlpG [Shewanella gelidii]MCL1099176.1 rhomboid family intramembrane serine protease GlpG [Shewanella gelidii]GGI81123.1 rhomboid family intramembrane serine protease GlpG [Shewanella gelidii]
MIEIGRLPNPRIAQAFIDYLKGLNIECQVLPAEHGVIIGIDDEQHAAQAQAEFQAFIQNPNDAKYHLASWSHGQTNKQDNSQLDYGAPSLQLATQFITGAGPLTLLMFLACTVVYVGLHYGFTEPVFNALSFFGAVGEINLAEFWRVFTPSLLHFTAMHIIFNLLWWWYLGGKIENRIGLQPLLILLCVGGTLPNIAQFYVAGPNFGGLSGVVYALVGYVWVMGHKRPEKGLNLPRAYIGFMLLWLVLGFVEILGSSTANAAHVTGLCVGLLQGWFDSYRLKPNDVNH